MFRLNCACCNGRADVVDWLMANTPSNVNKVCDLGMYDGTAITMTSLTTACYYFYAYVAMILLQLWCVSPLTVSTVNIQSSKYSAPSTLLSGKVETQRTAKFISFAETVTLR